MVSGCGVTTFLRAFSLATIAVAYLVYQVVHRPPGRELIKAVLLAVAFLFWAANQFWPSSPEATLYNDIAIALFVFDVFLVMIGWPPGFAGRVLAKPVRSQPSGTEFERSSDESV